MSSSQRHVRPAGRPVYNRPQPLRSARRGGRPPLQLGVLPRRLLLLAAAGIVVVFGLYKLSTIESIVIDAPSDQAKLQTEVKAALAEQWGQGSLLTFKAAILARDLVQADPVVKSVMVKRRLPNGLTVTVALKQPSLGWSSGDQSYLLDRDGTVISILPSGASVPVVTDASNLPVTIGQRVVTTQFVSFVMQLAPALTALHLHPTSYTVKDTTLDLYVAIPAGYYVVFDTSRSAVAEVGDLKNLLAFMAAQHKTAAQYIDLRIAGRAYFQ